MDNFDRPLNKALRMAVLAGVGIAVELHIRRGDDLDARDRDGMTPLMLAASRNRATICSLLISAGVDPTSTDPLGRNALAIARSVEASEAAEIIEMAMPKVEDPSPPEPSTQQPFPDALIPVLDEDLGVFDLSDWESEEDAPVPEADETIVQSATALYFAISAHTPIDTAEDWEDFEALLPERVAPLSNFEDEERRAEISRLLLRAIREGNVPEEELQRVCENDDGSRNEEKEALLHLVISELGACTYEWVGPDPTSIGLEDDLKEEAEVAESLAYFEDLASGRNDPMRFYARELHRWPLLEPDEEVFLGQEMEAGIKAALDALAQWPTGISTILSMATEVAVGDVDIDIETFSSGGSLHLEEGEERQALVEAPDAFQTSNIDTSGESLSLSGGAREFAERTEWIEKFAQNGSNGNAGETSFREALDSARLTPTSLLQLAARHDLAEAAICSTFRKAIGQYADARNRMVLSNLRLVISIAKRYIGSGIPVDDLIQEGNIGLMKAVDRYDWHLGFRFSTYATWWIRQQITRAIADKGRMIRLPVHVHDMLRLILRHAESMESSTGRSPGAEELAAQVSISAAKVRELLKIKDEPLSIDEPGPSGLPLIEFVEDTSIPDLSVDIDRATLEQVFRQMLADMVLPRAAKIITLRFGLDGGNPMTLEEVGAQFDVTRERIRQIEAKAIKWLAHPCRAEMLGTFLDRDEWPSGGQQELATDSGKNAAEKISSRGRSRKGNTADELREFSGGSGKLGRIRR